MMAIENRRGKMMPIDASSLTSPVLCIISVSHTVPTPTKVAPTSRNGEFKSSVIKKASTMPRNTVCVMASAIMDMRRNTRKTPGMAHAMDTAMAMSNISV